MVGEVNERREIVARVAGTIIKRILNIYTHRIHVATIFGGAGNQRFVDLGPFRS